jgi:hypothetical protein
VSGGFTSRLAVEAAIVIGGAVLAAWIVGQSPAVRDWIRQQWGPARPGCDCTRT